MSVSSASLRAVEIRQLHVAVEGEFKTSQGRAVQNPVVSPDIFEFLLLVLILLL